MAERVGFESAIKQQFNNMQARGWQPSVCSAVEGRVIGL